MSSQDSIIPTSIPKFNTWIVNTNARQLANNPDSSNPYWTDYGWTSAQSTEYSSRTSQWVTIVYPKHTNPLTSTSVVKKATVEFIEDFTEWVREQNLIEKILASGIADEEDEATWEFDLERDTPTKLSAKIEGVPVADVKGIGRGDFDIHVMRSEDANRASIAREEGANAVQFSFAVVQDPDLAGELDPDASNMQKGISTKAHFPFSAGAANRAKWLVIYTRWYNTNYPQYGGTWSDPTVTVIP